MDPQGAASGARTPAAAPVEPGVVLLVDDEPLLLRSLQRILEREGHRALSAGSLEEAEPLVERDDLDVVLVDLLLAGRNGLELLDRVKRERPELEVIVMTGHASIESAVGSIRRGAFDYLAKPFDDVHRVRTTVGKALERRRLLRRNRELEEQLEGRAGGPELVGSSPRMRALGRTLESLRHNESSVLLQGESGTGKELVARAIHARSPRARGPFVPVDCSSLPESIIESELFGHERGAFTGAVGAAGLFRMADGGTLFLDEIGELPKVTQAKLLRALQEKEVRPLGATLAVSVDIRVIAATHRDLERMVSEGRFRADLFYRLNVVRVRIPALRERREDIPLLVQHFLAKHRAPGRPITEVEPAALEQLVAADWDGNVRELENTVESVLALSPGPRLRAQDLPRLRRSRVSADVSNARLPLSLSAYERAVLERALAECGGDASEAARRLGIGRSTFYRKLTRHRAGPG